MLMQKKKFNVVCILKASITEQWLVFDVEFHMLKSPQKYFSLRFKLQYIKPKGEKCKKTRHKIYFHYNVLRFYAWAEEVHTFISRSPVCKMGIFYTSKMGTERLMYEPM